MDTIEGTEFRRHEGQEHLDIRVICLAKLPWVHRPSAAIHTGHFYVCGSARQVPEDIYTAMKEAGREGCQEVLRDPVEVLHGGWI